MLDDLQSQIANNSMRNKLLKQSKDHESTGSRSQEKLIFPHSSNVIMKSLRPGLLNQGKQSMKEDRSKTMRLRHRLDDSNHSKLVI